MAVYHIALLEVLGGWCCCKTWFGQHLLAW